MNVKVKLNHQALKAFSISQVQAAKQTAEQMRTEKIQDQQIPFDTGNLQNVVTHIDSSKVSTGKVSIVHDGPYATKLYFHPEYNFQKTFNANARGEWWEDYLRGSKKKRPAELFRQFYKKLTGRYLS